MRFAHSPAVPLFEDVSFHLAAGWTGLVGENGAGKTTLLKLITRELRPEAGTVRVDGMVHLCEQSVERLTPDIEELIISPEAEVHRLLGKLRLDHGELARWPTLSPGERKRWQLAAALTSSPEVLLLDEPTNHLDADGRTWLLQALSRFEGVGIVVSHDRLLLDALTTKTLRLHRGAAQVHPGSYTSAKAQWESDEQRANAERAAAKDRAQRTIKKLHAKKVELASATAQTSAGARMKSPKDIDARTLMADYRASRAEQSHASRVKAMRSELQRAEETLDSLHVEKSVGRSIFVGYERAPMPTVLRTETRQVSRDARIRISGDNGAGKTTLLLQVLAASKLPTDKLLYLPQDLTAEEEAKALSDVRALPNDQKGRAFSLLAALGVDPDRLLASERPSHGEARKLVLARGLASHAWVVALDEPTNHLDLPSIERLHQALEQWPGALLLITHDDAFAADLTAEDWSLSAGERDSRATNTAP